MSVDSAENNVSNWGSNQWLVNQTETNKMNCGSWAQSVIDDTTISSNSNIPNNKLTNQNDLLNDENGSQNNISSHFEIEDLNDLYSIQWGKSVINHDNSWLDKHSDLSPSVSANEVNKNSGFKTSSSTLEITRNNNGTELWENNLRQTKELNNELQSPINQSPLDQLTNQTDTQWKKSTVNPANFGGTWGVEEDLTNVWTGIPNDTTAATTTNQLLNNTNNSNNSSQQKQNNVFRQQQTQNSINSINCDKNSLQISNQTNNTAKNWISDDNFTTPANNWGGESLKTDSWDNLNQQSDLLLNSSTPKTADNQTKNWNYYQNNTKQTSNSDWSNDVDKLTIDNQSVDDGTSLWGNPQGQNKVLLWKEESKRNNQLASNNEQWKKNSLNGQLNNANNKGNWNELNQDSLDRNNSIPGTPITQSNVLAWNDSLIYDSEVAKNNKRKLTKEMIVSSSPFRILVDMGFKEDDVENSLRNTNLNLQESIEELRLNTLKETSVEIDRRKQQSQNSSVQGGLPSVNNILLKTANKLPNQPNSSASNLPSEKLLSNLVQQIQLAVQSGHLNAQILNQQLAPTTIQLIYQLLQQIKIMQSLQHSGVSKNYFPNSYQVNQKIATLQKQINIQQALFFKQQQLQQQQTGNRQSAQANPMLNNLTNLTNDFNSLQLNQQPQSRLNQWKLNQDFNKDDLNYPDGLSTPNDFQFSRAPGAINKPTQQQQQQQYVLTPNSWTGNEENWQNLQVRTKEQLSANQLGSSAPQQFNYDNLVNTTADFNANNKQYNNAQAYCLNSGDVKPSDQMYNWSNKLVDNNDNLSNASSQAFTNSNTWTFSNSSQATPQQQQQQNIWNNSVSNIKPKGPPPGLTNTGLGGNQLKSLNLDQNSTFIIIRNLTIQSVDESTLRTLCMQHGPLLFFHMFLNNGLAIVKYSSKEEAIKAQSALNNCQLGNTTIQVNLANEQEVQQYCQLTNQQQQQNSIYQQQQQTNNNELNDYMLAAATVNNNGAWTNNVSLANVPNNNSLTNNASTMWSFNNQPNNLWNNIDQNSNNLQNLLPDNIQNLLGEST